MKTEDILSLGHAAPIFLKRELLLRQTDGRTGDQTLMLLKHLQTSVVVT